MRPERKLPVLCSKYRYCQVSILRMTKIRCQRLKLSRRKESIPPRRQRIGAYLVGGNVMTPGTEEVVEVKPSKWAVVVMPAVEISQTN